MFEICTHFVKFVNVVIEYLE